MSIFTLNGKRINIEVPYTDPVTGEYGISLKDPAQRTRFNIVEVAEPVKPVDFHEDTHFRTESDVAPFVVYTKKSQEMIDALYASRVEEKLSRARAMRENILNRLAGIALVAQLAGDTATVAGYVAARQGLLDITTGHPTDPTLVDDFILARYAAIVAACPPSLVSAFNGMNV